MKPTKMLLLALATIAALAASAAASPPEIEAAGADRLRLTLHSEILDEERTLLVRLPRGYEGGDESYPVLWLLDADWHFDIAAADVGLLSECGYIDRHPAPQLIVVGVENVDRNRDFTPTNCPQFRNMNFPTSGGAEAFRRFLVEEALPAVDAAFRTRPFRILAGWSLGGLFTVDTLLGGGSPFAAHLAISPSLWWDDGLVLKRLAEGEYPEAGGGQLVVTLGSAEIDGGTSVAEATGAFLDHLTANPLPGLDLRRLTLEGFGHNYAPKLAFFEGLATVFDDLALPAEALEGGLEAVDAHFAALTARYGYPMAAPEDVYGQLGWRLFEAGEREDAGAVFRAWNERHPESALATASLGSFLKESGETARAAELFERAITLEERSAEPRRAFIEDLRRDVAALRGDG